MSLENSPEEHNRTAADEKRIPRQYRLTLFLEAGTILKKNGQIEGQVEVKLLPDRCGEVRRDISPLSRS